MFIKICSSASQLFENRNVDCFTIIFYIIIMNASTIIKKIQVVTPDVINKLKNHYSTYFKINAVFELQSLRNH